MKTPCHCYAKLGRDEHIYCINYRYAGHEYGTYIVAKNLEDAEARLRHIKAEAWLTDGAIEFVPVTGPLTGPRVMLVVWIRNLWERWRRGYPYI